MLRSPDLSHKIVLWKNNILVNNSETMPAGPAICPARLVTDKVKGGYYIIQYITPLVWARTPVVRFAPLVRLTLLSPIYYTVVECSLNSMRTYLNTCN